MAEERGVLCISQMMFVHYNSKHTNAKSLAKNDDPATENLKTFHGIFAFPPSEDWMMGGQTIVMPCWRVTGR